MQQTKLNQLQNLNLNQLQQLNQLTQQKTRQELKTRQVKNPNETNKTREPFKPFPKIDLPKKDSLFKESKQDKAIFEALTKRYGKEFSLGSFGTQLEAEDKLKRTIVGTLAASGKIKKNSKELSFSELKSFGRGFNKGKRDSYKVVQTRGFRLESYGERKEIKGSKKNKIW
jgi:membrane-anchored protein YejM (alkaline phosphatase superfamily)